MDGSHLPEAPVGASTRSEGAVAAEPSEPASSFLSRLMRALPFARPPVEVPAGARFGSTPAQQAAKAAVERTLMANVLRMRDQRVADVMIPRADIVAAPETASLRDLLEKMREGALTRLPIYRETLDDPIGFVHLKDLVFAYGFGGEAGEQAFDLHRHLRPLVFAPPSMSTAKLLERMRGARKHIALVIDEYGGVDGLVTIEDLVEQIVGEIDDEHDDADPAPWREEAPGVFLADARADVAEFEAALGVDLLPPDLDEEVDTLGGLVFILAGRVPEQGEVVETAGGCVFEVVEADSRRIKRLRVRRDAGPGPEASSAAA